MDFEVIIFIDLQSSEDRGRLKVFCCDLFKMNIDMLETPIDRVFDRGSYVAIEREDRQKYVKLMLSLMSSKFRYLLAAVQYDPTRFEGPPICQDRPGCHQQASSGSESCLGS